MTIDWITVSAQIVNFLILVWLLQRLLYRPVTRAMAARERRIADQVEEAVRREEAASAAEARHTEAARLLEAERADVLAAARAAAAEDRKRLLEEARAEATEARTRWHQQLAAEQAELGSRMRRQLVTALEAMLRKTLTDLADARLEEQMIGAFVRRLNELDEAGREALQSADPLEVTTAFEADGAARKRLSDALRDVAGAGREIQFRRSAELIAGLQLTSDGQRLGWNLEEYTESLSERLEQALGLPPESAGSV